MNGFEELIIEATYPVMIAEKIWIDLEKPMKRNHKRSVKAIAKEIRFWFLEISKECPPIHQQMLEVVASENINWKKIARLFLERLQREFEPKLDNS